jgi:hypothetical protein
MSRKDKKIVPSLKGGIGEMWIRSTHRGNAPKCDSMGRSETESYENDNIENDFHFTGFRFASPCAFRGRPFRTLVKRSNPCMPKGATPRNVTASDESIG